MPKNSFTQKLLASVAAVALLGGGALGASAFVGPINAPTGGGFTSQGSTVATMSGSLTDALGAGFVTGTDSLEQISGKIDALPWAAVGGSGAVVNDGGNVGIGTATPGNTLTVHDSAAPVLQLTNDTSGTTFADGFQFAQVGSDAYMTNYENGHMRFATNNTERMRIDSSGNVGIGKSAYGAMTTDGVWFQPASLSQISVTSSFAPLYLNQNGAGDLLDLKNAGTTKFLVDNSGNVGIGTASPSTLLGLESSGSVTAITINNTASYVADLVRSRITFEGTTSYGNHELARIEATTTGGTYGSGELIFSNRKIADGSNSESMRIDNQGNVGIGTASPSAKLHVKNGDVHIENGSIYLDDIRHYTAGSTPITIGNSQQIAVRNDTNRVGIGTTAPAYKLDVNGTIRGYGITDSSDARLKENITDLGSTLDKVSQLRGVKYLWKDRVNHDDDEQIGFIAQEVEPIFPEVVETADDGYKSIQYGKMTAVLVEAVKELKAENDALRARVDALEAR